MLVGCSGVIAEPSGSRPSPDPGVDPDRADTPTILSDCRPEEARPSGSPLRRLTPSEWNTSAAALFAGVALPTVSLVADPEVHGFRNNALSQPVSDVGVERFESAAVEIAAVAVVERGWMSCTEASLECGVSTTLDLATRAFRRPLSTEDQSDLETFFTNSYREWGFDSALRVMIETVLQSPEFVYRPELGDPTMSAPEGLVALSGPELAVRLAYFVTGGPPDQELQRAAAAGELSENGAVEAQARRLLATPAARHAFRHFHREWFDIHDVERVVLDTELFPELTNAVRSSLVSSTERYFEHVFFEAGTIDALFLSNVGFVDNNLADIFGVSPPRSTDLVPVELDVNERSGLLTQPGLLVATAAPTNPGQVRVSHTPVMRGVMMLEAVFCDPTGAAPPGVNVNVPTATGTAPTTRARYETLHRQPSCAGCHHRIDGIGFALENYDALGRHRTVEAGVEIDATGELVDTLDIDGEIDGAIELAQVLTSSEQVTDCVVRHYLGYALGRSLTEADSCQLYQLRSALGSASGSLQELVVALVTSPSFRYRVAP